MYADPMFGERSPSVAKPHAALPSRLPLRLLALGLMLAWLGCGDDEPPAADASIALVDAASPTDATSAADGGTDASASPDAAHADAMTSPDATASFDAAVSFDAGTTVDAAADAGTTVDAAIDAAPPTGNVLFTWTVNDQPASVACPAGGTMTITDTAGPHAISDRVEACVAGTALLVGLAPGEWTFSLTLSDGVASSTVDNVVVNVEGGATAHVANVNFPWTMMTGAASITWLIEGGTKSCPVGASVTVTMTGANTGEASTDCTAPLLSFVGLVPGSTTFTAVLQAPVVSEDTVTDAATTTIEAGLTAEVGLDFTPCSFCP